MSQTMVPFPSASAEIYLPDGQKTVAELINTTSPSSETAIKEEFPLDTPVISVDADVSALSAIPDTQQWMQQQMQRTQASGGRADGAADSLASSDDLDIFDYVTDVIKGVANGPVNAVNETIDLAGTIAQGGEEFDWVEKAKEKGWDVSNFGETQTTIGGMAEDVSTFIFSFITFGKALKAANFLQGAGKAATFARGTVQGIATDLAAFDGHSENLFSLPLFRDTIVESWSAKEDLSELQGRLQNAAVGAGIGAALEFGIALGAKAWARMFAKSQQEADGILLKAYEQIEEIQAAKGSTVDDLMPAEASASTSDLVDGINTIGNKAASITSRQPDMKVPTEEALTTTEVKTRNAPEREADTAYARTDYETVKTEADKIVDETLTSINSPEPIDDVMKRVSQSINLRTHFLHGENGLRVLDDIITKTYRDTLKAKGPETLETVMKNAEELEVSGFNGLSKLLEDAQAGRIPVSEVGEVQARFKGYISWLTEEKLRLATKKAMTPGSFSLQDAYDAVHYNDLLLKIHTSSKNLETFTGRGLNAHKLTGEQFADAVFGGELRPISEGLSKEELAMEIAKKGYSKKQIDKMLHDDYLNRDVKAAICRNGLKVRPGSVLGVLNEFRINNMLSGPFTVTTNGITAAGKTLFMPAERYIGGVISRNPAMRQEALDTFHGLFRYISDSWSLAKKAWNVQDNILDNIGGGKLENTTAQITYENIRNIMLKGKDVNAQLSDFQEIMARSLSFLGPYVRIPSRLLMTTDEFFKQLNFRASLDASLRREAREAGLTNADAIEAYINRKMNEAFTSEGLINKKAFSKDQFQKHLQYAREATWTEDLGMDTLGGKFQQFANACPSVRLVVPFIKTPTNILRDFVAHTPGLAYLTKTHREALKAGGETAAMAKAKLATGSMTILPALLMAQAGLITGTPPKDPKLRDALMNTGWQPYSLKVGDRYYSYRRLDPVAMFLGISADLAVIGKDALAGGKTSMEMFSQCASGLAIAATNNVVSKTWMQGVSEVVGFLNNPNESWEQFSGRFAATLVPFASGTRFIRQQADDPMREMRGIMDYTLNTIPGFSTNLPAKYNWVTGETINYALVGRDKQDIVLDELNNMADSIYGPPDEKLRGVELTGAQYSRLNELHGTIRLNGKTMYEAMEELIRSPDYDLDRAFLGDPPDKESGPRARMLKKLIRSYRNAAQRALLSEDTELAAEIRKSDFQRMASRRGQMTTLNQQELLETLLEY